MKVKALGACLPDPHTSAFSCLHHDAAFELGLGHAQQKIA